jgi:hypothetical protein
MTTKTANALNTAAIIAVVVAMWCWVWYGAGRTF